MKDNVHFGGNKNHNADKEQIKRLTLDESFKRMIATPEVLAPIFYEVVDEFKDYSLEEVLDVIKRSRIDGDVDVLNLEDYGDGEDSLITYDSLVTVDMSDVSGKRHDSSLHQVYTSVIVDTEMQRDRPGYVLENRAQYYAARLLSRQLKSINQTENYDKLIPVYSIWIVRNPYEVQRNSVCHYVFKDGRGRAISNHDGRTNTLMHVVMVYLPKPGSETADELLNYLMAIFTKNLAISKLTRLIQNNREVKKGVEKFMTLETAVLEEGRKEGMVWTYHKMGFSKDEIVEETGLSEERVQEILDSME